MCLERMRVGDMTRCGGWFSSLWGDGGVSHTLGSWDREEGLRITPGVVADHFHSWLVCGGAIQGAGANSGQCSHGGA